MKRRVYVRACPGSEFKVNDGEPLRFVACGELEGILEPYPCPAAPANPVAESGAVPTIMSLC